jgi:hypothetical protein
MDSRYATSLSICRVARSRSERVPHLQRGSDTVRIGFKRILSQIMATPLQYFQPSPVRGQLEPPDATTRPGWRYLQCTDTPNELKGKQILMAPSPTTDPGPTVLLPPRASQVFAYLLSQEQVELSKGAEASWERLMHIRHLKDRMISEYSRLSRVHPSLNHRQQGSAGVWLASAPHIAKNLSSALSTLPQILLSRYVRFRNRSEQSLNRALGTREMV